ncbi:hypothetical protein UlMin_003569 [Ulmus minor]
MFEGDNPFGWLFRAECYFAINGIAEAEKVYAASIFLEGPTLNWFQWINDQTPFLSWRAFCSALLQRFGHVQGGDPTEKLLGIRQETSVADYRACFEQFAATTRGFPDSVGVVFVWVDRRWTMRPNFLATVLRGAPAKARRASQLQVLLLSEEDSGLDNGKPKLNQGIPNSSSSPSSFNLSFNSLLGFTSSHTMKVKGFLGTREVVILFDSGVSHNFIASTLVRELKLPCEATFGLGVRVGNMMSFEQQRICKGVKLEIQGCRVQEDFFLFELGSADVVLGVTWLYTLV